MAQMKIKQGNAYTKRNTWIRGNGMYSMRGELKRGISLNKKLLNRKVRHAKIDALNNGEYKKICKTLRMVDFS